MPQQRFALHRRFWGDGSKSHGNGRVVMQHQRARAIAGGFKHGPRQGQPLRLRVWAKTAGQQPQGISRLLQRAKAHRLAQVLPDTLQGLPFNGGAHIVEHEAAHRHGQRQLGLAAHHQANQTAHAGAHPVQRTWLQLLEQLQHVGGVLGNLVAHGVLEPVALASAHNIWADHTHLGAATRAQGLGQHVKVSPLARQAMHTEHHMTALRVAPLPIGHAVSLSGACNGVRTLYVIQRRFGHGEIKQLKNSSAGYDASDPA